MEWDAVLKGLLGTPLAYAVGLLAVGLLFAALVRPAGRRATASAGGGNPRPRRSRRTARPDPDDLDDFEDPDAFEEADEPERPSKPKKAAKPAKSNKPNKPNKPKRQGQQNRQKPPAKPNQQRKPKQPAQNRRPAKPSRSEAQKEFLDKEAEDAADHARTLQRVADDLKAQNRQNTYRYIDQMAQIAESWMKAREWHEALDAVRELLVQGVFALRSGLLDADHEERVKELLIEHLETFVEAAIATDLTGEVSVLESLRPEVEEIDDWELTAAFNDAIDQLNT